MPQKIQINKILPGVTFLSFSSVDTWRIKTLENELTYIKKIVALSKGKRILDLGACVGMVTNHVAAVADKVVCLEPDPDIFDHLEQNVKANFYTNVVPIQAAFGHECKTIRLYRLPTVNVKSPSTLAFESSIPVDVESVDLAYLESRYGKFDLIKSDIEGDEYLLPDQITKPYPILCVEVHPKMLAARNKKWDSEKLLKTHKLYWEKKRSDQIHQIWIPVY